MIDQYNLSEKKMDEILQKRDNMLENICFYDYKVVQLLEEPEGAERPRFRLTKKKIGRAHV